MSEKKHPADGMVLRVEVGDGAVMSLPDPGSYRTGGICWTLTYGNPHGVKHAAVSVIKSYDYLLDEGIPATEAIRRLRLLRKARSLAASHPHTVTRQGEKP